MRILLATDAWDPQVNGVVRTLARTTAAPRRGSRASRQSAVNRAATTPHDPLPEVEL